MSDQPLYRSFLGTWELIPKSCVFEQSAPPRSGSLQIVETTEGLRFDMAWVDAEGDAQEASFGGVPDGEPRPFDGGELADAMSVTVVSERDLRSSAFHEGQELMVVQRQLDDTGQAMRVTQLVRLPDGSTPINVSIYRRSSTRV